MDQGAVETQENRAVDAALKLVVVTLEQNKIFFAPRLAQMHEELRLLVRYCRCQKRSNSRESVQLSLQNSLLRLFGVHVIVPADGQLSLLARLIRVVLVDCARIQRDEDIRGGVHLLLAHLRQQLNAVTFTANVDLLALNAAFERMAAHHPACVRLLELRYFARLGARDIAHELNLSVDAVRYDLRFAKAWLLASVQVSGLTSRSA